MKYPYKSRRTATYGREGMVAAGNPYATNVGIELLKAGGNAVDAAIGMAMTHVVVEPMNNGLGSDAFAIVSMDHKLYGLNASGPAPKQLTGTYLKSLGLDKIPAYGPLTVDVPGMVAGWIALHERFGTLALETVAKPAIKYAREGFVLTPSLAKFWAGETKKYRSFGNDPALDGYFHIFTDAGITPEAGELVKLPHHGDTLEAIATTNGEAFYRGEIAKDLVSYLQELGGKMDLDDLANFQVEWVEPISVNYGGVDVWELPPNGHGLTVLMALEILNQLNLETEDRKLRTHYAIEALKMAYVDTKAYIAEPQRMEFSYRELLDRDYLKARADKITKQASMPKIGRPKGSSTVYFATADRDGNMVSFIQSNYEGFGSGVVHPKWGIALNNRVCNFDIDESSPNGLVGGTRPYHTIIPGFLSKNGRALGPFGVMGAFMQPQGHLQVLLRMIDEGLNPQAALDAPRWQWFQGQDVEYEEAYERDIVEDLKARGHKMRLAKTRDHMGRGQIILRQDNGIYIGGTEPRTDGSIIGI